MIDIEHGDESPHSSGLTLRALSLGSFLGVLFGAQNIYFGLKTGSSFGATITCALIGFGLLKAIQKGGAVSVHEINILQTAGVAGTSMIFAGGFSTYILALSTSVRDANGDDGTAVDFGYWQLVAWQFSFMYFGYFLAIPFRQRLIVDGNYPWPSPTATASVLRTMCSNDGSDSAQQTLNFLVKVLLGSLAWFLFSGYLFQFHDTWPLYGCALAKYGFVQDWSTAYVATGLLMPFNAIASIFAGALVVCGLLIPVASAQEGVWFKSGADGFDGLKAYWFLPVLAITVVDSIYQMCKLLYTIIDNCSMRSLTKDGKSKQLLVEEEADRRASKNSSAEVTQDGGAANAADVAASDPARDCVPDWIWQLGIVVNAGLLLVTTPLLFGVSWYWVLLAEVFAPMMAYGINIGAAITDTALLSATGKMLIMILGAAIPEMQHLLIIAGLGIAVVGGTNDMLADYQTAHLLGTSPRAMFIGQLFGATVAAFVTPLSYQTLKGAFAITSTGAFTAPGAMALRDLSLLFTQGWDILPENSLFFVGAMAALALVNNVLKDALPEQYAKYLPNTMAFAIGGYVADISYGVNPALGYMLAAWFRGAFPGSAEQLIPALAGGLIAGEGIGSVVQASLSVLGLDPPASLAIHFGVASFGANQTVTYGCNVPNT